MQVCQASVQRSKGRQNSSASCVLFPVTTLFPINRNSKIFQRDILTAIGIRIQEKSDSLRQDSHILEEALTDRLDIFLVVSNQGNP